MLWLLFLAAIPTMGSEIGADATLDRAAQLLEADQPARALELFQPVAERHRDDPNVLTLAGLAAYHSDHLQTALNYWKQSLDLEPNEKLARVYERVRVEEAFNRRSEKLEGIHVTLRFEDGAVPVDGARAILSLLDEDYVRISEQLGCSSEEPVAAVVESRETYLGNTGAAEWSGGQYNSRIHIAWTEATQLNPRTRSAIAHEMVHACLSRIPSGSASWPTWLEEGLAQKLSGDTLAPSAREQLRRLVRGRHIPRLEDLCQDWSGLSIENARLAYNLALAATDSLFESRSADGIREMLKHPESLHQIAAELNKKLGR